MDDDNVSGGGGFVSVPSFQLSGQTQYNTSQAAPPGMNPGTMPSFPSVAPYNTAPPPVASQVGAASAVAPPAAPAQAQLFAVVVPGRHMALDWQPMGETRAVLAEPIQAGSEVPDVMISVLPGSTFLRPDQAAVFYWSVDGAEWSLLGAVTLAQPSSMFRTGWGALVAPGASVRLAVSLESIDVAKNLGLSACGEALEDRATFAAAIARDLWAFLTSFAQGVQSNGEMMLVPTTVLDKWLTRFNSKFARDPNFMLKAKDSL